MTVENIENSHKMYFNHLIRNYIYIYTNKILEKQTKKIKLPKTQVKQIILIFRDS